MYVIGVPESVQPRTNTAPALRWCSPVWDSNIRLHSTSPPESVASPPLRPITPTYLRACVPPPDITANFVSLPLPFASEPSAATPFPPSLRGPTLDIASSHLVCSVVLTGVLALQAGRWWAEQADVDDDDAEEIVDTEDERARTREGTPLGETKKTK